MRIRRAGRADTLGDWWLAQFETFLIHVSGAAWAARQPRKGAHEACKGILVLHVNKRSMIRWSFRHVRIPIRGI